MIHFNKVQMHRTLIAVFLVTQTGVASAVPASCPDGTFTSNECVRQLREADQRLIAIYADKEQWIRRQHSASEPSMLQDNLRLFRKANAAWKMFRANECLSSALADGMNPQAANDVALACEVDLTRDRLKRLEGENWRKH